METLTLQLDPERPQEDAIEWAASIIRGGGLVAFPTETVYGLGADATRESAIQKIFKAKDRPADNPLIVHVSDREMLSLVARNISREAEVLIERFWPGPLTLVLERKAEIARSVSAGLPTVAVRMPKNKVALELIRRSRVPIAAPSANRSGRPSPTSAAHVARDIGGRIDMILDAGRTTIGIESTVLDMTVSPPVILRPGWITREMLAGVLGKVENAASEEELRRSPGTRHRHYSPRARVVLIERASPQFIAGLLARFLESGPVGLISHTVVDIENPDLEKIVLEETAAAYARSIYSRLRELDEKNLSVIVVEGIDERGEGAAVMDRLRRAASEIIEGDG
ncbi:MAG: threonylcarbamoyl-AMP synthase [Blastocatellia bacterium]|nr:threonylcarbamoyl-AMP synthase [Blastocatellia bacterium]